MIEKKRSDPANSAIRRLDLLRVFLRRATATTARFPKNPTPATTTTSDAYGRESNGSYMRVRFTGV